MNCQLQIANNQQNKAMNLNNLTIKSQEAVQRAQQLAMENNSQQIEPGHLLAAIMEVDENVTPFVFKKLGVNYDVLRKATNSIVKGYPTTTAAGEAGKYMVAPPTKSCSGPILS